MIQELTKSSMEELPLSMQLQSSETLLHAVDWDHSEVAIWLTDSRIIVRQRRKNNMCWFGLSLHALQAWDVRMIRQMRFARCAWVCCSGSAIIIGVILCQAYLDGVFFSGNGAGSLEMLLTGFGLVGIISAIVALVSGWRTVLTLYSATNISPYDIPIRRNWRKSDVVELVGCLADVLVRVHQSERADHERGI